MTLTQTPQSKWKECEQGSLVRYASLERSRAQYRSITKMAFATAVILVAVVSWTAFAVSWNSLIEPNYGGIVCSKVQSKSSAYLAGTLDDDTKSRVEAHLKQCSKCASWMKQFSTAQASDKGRMYIRYVFTTIAPVP